MLSSVEGVELAHVFSRYTFLIGIGSMFNFSEVKLEIQHRLCGTHNNEFSISKIEDETIKASVIEAKRALARYNNWAIYVCPNGAIKHIESNDANTEYKNKLQTLKEALLVSQGLLLSSEFK